MSVSGTERTQLPIQGMTCASCVRRVEKGLNELDGVAATVNFATEQAAVEYEPGRVELDDLVARVESLGYQATLPSEPSEPSPDDAAAEADREATNDLRARLIVASVLSAPILLISMIPPLQFEYWQWLMWQLATPVVFWCGWPFHRAAWRALQHGTATMDTLISVGTLAAWGWSVVALFFLGAGEPGLEMPFEFTTDRGAGSGHVYFEVAAVVTTFILAGRYFEARAKRNAGAALRALLELGAKDVAVLDADGRERRIPVEELRVEDRFAVRPGEKIATDGVVEEGRSAVDQSLITGESVPHEVQPGDQVVGGTINVGGRLIVRSTRIGADTALAQIGRMVVEAQSGKAPAQRLADQVSAIFVPVVIALAVAALGFWLGNGTGTAFAFSAAVAVLIVACPCALGLATPTALLVGTGRGAQLGILIKGPEVLESARRVDTVVLDKTGTVTTGKMTLTGIEAADPDQVLAIAGSLEAASEHPIAAAIASAARDRLGAPTHVDEFGNHEGRGVEGTVGGRLALVGKPSFLAERGYEIDEALDAKRLEAEAAGLTAVGVGWDGRAHGILTVADAIKETSREAVDSMRELGLEPVLLTGDNRTVAETVAGKLGIDRVIAEVLPQDKARVVRELQEGGEVVAMVGDGVNDAPALASADLGLAVGTGADVAIEASDLTLISGDLRRVGDAIRLAQRTRKTIQGNLFWAFAYNVAAIPLAALGFLNPLVAGATMAGSSLFVVSNSLRLRSFRPRRP